MYIVICFDFKQYKYVRVYARTPEIQYYMVTCVWISTHVYVCVQSVWLMGLCSMYTHPHFNCGICVPVL